MKNEKRKKLTKEEKKRRINEIVDNLRLIDDALMTVVLQKTECAELVLRIIMNKNDLKVTSCKSQYNVKNLRGRSARLDVYATDSTGKIYNIEVQRSEREDLAKRSRYYSSLIDADNLVPTENYSEIPDTYVIFITETDFYGEGEALYEIERTIKGKNNTLFNDGSHIVFVNSQVQNDTALGKLMKDFYCVKPEDMNYDILAEEAKNHKYERGRKRVCKSIEDFAKELAEEGKEETSIKIAVKLLSKGNYSLEDIAEITELSLDKIKKLAENTQNN